MNGVQASSDSSSSEDIVGGEIAGLPTNPVSGIMMSTSNPFIVGGWNMYYFSPGYYDVHF